MEATFKLTIAIITGLILVQCTPTETIPLSNISYHREYISNNKEGPNKLKTFKKYESYLLDDEIGDSIGNTPYIYYHLSRIEEDDKYLNEGLKKFPNDPYLNLTVAVDENDPNIQDSLYLSIFKKHPRFDLSFYNYLNNINSITYNSLDSKQKYKIHGEYSGPYSEEELILREYKKINQLYQIVDSYENGTNNSNFYDFEQINSSGLDSLQFARMNNRIKYIKEKHSFLQNRKPKPWDNEKLSLKKRIILFVENELFTLNKSSKLKDPFPVNFFKLSNSSYEKVGEPVTITLSSVFNQGFEDSSKAWVNNGVNSFNADRNKNGIIDGTKYDSDGKINFIPSTFQVIVEYRLRSQFFDQKCFDEFKSTGYMKVEMTIDNDNPKKILWWYLDINQDINDEDLGDYFKEKESMNTLYERVKWYDYYARKGEQKEGKINKTYRYWNSKNDFIKWFKSNTNPSNTELNNCLGIRFD